MTRRTQEEWQVLVEAQKHSGLTQTKFCEQHDINPKYFSLRKSQLKTTGNIVTTKPSAFVAARIQPRMDCIEVVHQRTHLKLPASLSADWLAQFVQQLG